MRNNKHEAPQTIAYWKRLGKGTLLLEYPIVKTNPSENIQRRNVDGIILLNGKFEKIEGKDALKNYSLKDQDIICIQTKNRPKNLGMSVMGQALFSQKIIEQFHQPKSIKTVILCHKVDSFLAQLLEEFEIEVVTFSP